MLNDSTNLPDHSGRTLLITGACGSLGSVASKALAAAGAQLILLDKNVSQLERLSDEITDAGHSMPALYPLDLLTAVEADYQTLANLIDENFGCLHGLLHSAADLGALQPLSDISAAAWQASLLINLTAPFLLTKALLPLLLQSEGACVVFTTDSSARGNKAYWGTYGVAKNTLEGLACVWAQELESRFVKIHTLSPGPIRSAIRRKTHPGELLDALAPADDLAPVYVRLMHPSCDKPTGSLIER